MNDLQRIFVVVFSVIAAYGGIRGYLECKKKHSMTETRFLWPFGGFVWADMVIFGVFWLAAGVITLLLNDWVLFLLIFSLFWLVRSIGETAYWFLQQFSTLKRNPPERMLFYNLFRNDAVWFVYQIFWQCMTVVFILTSLYLGAIWLHSL